MEGSQPETDASTAPPLAALAITSREHTDVTTRDVVFDLRDVDLYYGATLAVSGLNMLVHKNVITAMIGPSGCGKSTVVRTLNRMNDSIPGFRVSGQVLYHDHDVYAGGVDPVEVRRRIGMVFQRPNPFPKSIYDNIAWAPRLLGQKHNLDERVEKALRGAALWDEVKDKLHEDGRGLSGGQQQRLCIARTLALHPEVILFDEPTSALDPISAQKIEALIADPKRDITIVIVTHNMEQAQRCADKVAFFYLGEMIEAGSTGQMFDAPRQRRTQDYMAGTFG